MLKHTLYRDFRGMHGREAQKRIRAWEVLIIDECSMIKIVEALLTSPIGHPVSETQAHTGTS